MVNIKSPGRICLFGEHQDYLDLPVIAMGISLFSTLKGQRIANREVIIHKLDIDEVENFSLDYLFYDNEKNYYKSGIRICMKEGLKFSKGFQVEVQSNIPFQSGCGSSSSIMVAWIYFLTQISDNPQHIPPSVDNNMPSPFPPHHNQKLPFPADFPFLLSSISEL